MRRSESAPRPSPGALRRPAREPELRVFGVNACAALFARRPQAIRKVYLVREHLERFRALLAYCVRERIGYRFVSGDELVKITQSSHHEGICLAVRREPLRPLASLLATLPAARPSLLLVLDGVGNPHNLGAVLRSAAHFGIDAVLVPAGAGLDLSGAACRVAEGGAESVPLVALGDAASGFAALRAAGFALAATVVEGGRDLFREALPSRLALVMGAEQTGVSAAVRGAVPLHLGIPGSGAVESLNIAVAAAVFMAEFRRRHPLAGTADATPDRR